MLKKRTLSLLMWFLYALATLQMIGFYVVSTRFYLNIHDYLQGRERIPFQERILAAVLLRAMLHIRPLVTLFTHLHGVFAPPERGAFFVLSFVSFCIAGFFCVRLYRAVSTQQTLGFLVYPVFLSTTLWSYALQVQQDNAYPYDMTSLAFFTAGLYFIYTHRFLPLLAVILIGTFNRETTLFLIILYVIDAATDASATTLRLRLSQVPWLRVALLSLIWLSVKLTLVHLFAHNVSENELRLRENFGYLSPKHWPALLNICGYLVPAILLMRAWIRPQRFANYLLIVPIWVAIMFLTGILVETRIYGELSSYTAIAAVLILEYYVKEYYVQRLPAVQPR